MGFILTGGDLSISHSGLRDARGLRLPFLLSGGNVLTVYHELEGELYAEARWGLMGFKDGEWVLLEERGTDMWLRLLRFVRFHPDTKTWMCE